MNGLNIFGCNFETFKTTRYIASSECLIDGVQTDRQLFVLCFWCFMLCSFCKLSVNSRRELWLKEPSHKNKAQTLNPTQLRNRTH